MDPRRTPWTWGRGEGWCARANPGATRTDADLLTLASRFTVDRNTAPPGERTHDASLVLHVEREVTGRWFLRQTGPGGMIFNVERGRFDVDWAFTHPEHPSDRDAYLLDRDEALDLAAELPLGVLTGHEPAWQRVRRG
jgi:hypothetical protein